MARDEAVSLQERIGVAANAASLAPATGEGTAALELLGALGAATHVRSYNSASGRMECETTAVGTPVIHPKRRLAALLERAKYGRDQAAAHQAVMFFAYELGRRQEFRNFSGGNPLRIRLAAMVITEWMHDHCPQCGGFGSIPHGIGRTTRRMCGVCQGRGMARCDHAARAHALRLPFAAYEKHWVKRFSEAHRLLATIELSNLRPLQSQIRRGTLASVSEYKQGSSRVRKEDR